MENPGPQPTVDCAEARRQSLQINTYASTNTSKAERGIMDRVEKGFNRRELQSTW